MVGRAKLHVEGGRGRRDEMGKIYDGAEGEQDLGAGGREHD